MARGENGHSAGYTRLTYMRTTTVSLPIDLARWLRFYLLGSGGVSSCVNGAPWRYASRWAAA